MTDQRAAEPAVVTQCPILPITSKQELRSQLLSIWTDSVTKASQDREGGMSTENLKGHLEVVGREMIIGTAVSWQWITGMRLLYQSLTLVSMSFSKKSFRKTSQMHQSNGSSSQNCTMSAILSVFYLM